LPSKVHAYSRAPEGVLFLPAKHNRGFCSTGIKFSKTKLLTPVGRYCPGFAARYYEEFEQKIPREELARIEGVVKEEVGDP
jgi:hypothetical protein